MLHDRKWCAHREADQLWSVSLILLVILSRSSQCLIRSRLSRGSELLHTVSTESSAGTCVLIWSCAIRCRLPNTRITFFRFSVSNSTEAMQHKEWQWGLMVWSSWQLETSTNRMCPALVPIHRVPLCWTNRALTIAEDGTICLDWSSLCALGFLAVLNLLWTHKSKRVRKLGSTCGQPFWTLLVFSGDNLWSDNLKWMLITGVNRVKVFECVVYVCNTSPKYLCAVNEVYHPLSLLIPDLHSVATPFTYIHMFVHR